MFIETVRPFMPCHLILYQVLYAMRYLDAYLSPSKLSLDVHPAHLLIPQAFTSELLQNLVGCKQSEIGREVSFPAFVAFVVFGCESSFHRRLLDQDVTGA